MTNEINPIYVLSGALAGKFIVDVFAGYLLAYNNTKKGLDMHRSEQNIKTRLVEPDIEFMSRPGRKMAYWLHGE